MPDTIYCTWSVCVSVSTYSRTTGTKLAHERYQQLQRNARKIIWQFRYKDAVRDLETGIIEDHVA